MRMLVSQGNGCYGNRPRSVLCYRSSTTGREGGGSDGPVTSGDEGGWWEEEGGREQTERDRARLKGHWIWSVCCTAGLKQTVRWLLPVLKILENSGKVKNVLTPLGKFFELENVLIFFYSETPHLSFPHILNTFLSVMQGVLIFWHILIRKFSWPPINFLI